MTMHKQFKGKSCKKFGAFLWKSRTYTPKQEKTIALNNKKLQTKKLSNFAIQLRAKQLVSALYGQLKLQQVTQLLKQSQKYKGKLTHIFFSLLEKRLDSCLVQLKFAPTFGAARQMITHQKVFVNRNIVKSPGFLLKPGDSIQFSPDIKTAVFEHVQKSATHAETHKLFIYKSLHFEVNYKLLEAIYLFSPQQIHYPTQIEPELFMKSLR